MPKIFISTIPFGQFDNTPLVLLKEAGIEVVINPIGRKLKEAELAELIGDYDALIAGTEPITDKVLSQAKRLKLISRVGIGLDSVDLHAARKRDIRVSYTPDAPAKAVAELTMGLIFSLLRHTHVSNNQIHLGQWKRLFGRRLSEITVGLIGVGRIGSDVLCKLSVLGCQRILAHDICQNPHLKNNVNFEWVDPQTIYREADLISLHVPLTRKTRNLLTAAELLQMKPDAFLINTARGGIVNENDLALVLEKGHLGGVALDVFEQEPYEGPLCAFERCLLTAHMGSMSLDCRARMELEATTEAIAFLTGQALTREVPEAEYECQA